MSQIVRTPDSPLPGRQVSDPAAQHGPLATALGVPRYILRKILLAIVMMIGAAWRHPIITLAVAAALFFGYQQFVAESGGAEPAAAEVQDLRVDFIEPAPVVLDFLQAQRDGNVEALWATYSEEWKRILLDAGGSPEVTRQSYADLRTAGMGFDESDYIGGREQSNGETVYIFSTPQTEPGHEPRDFIQVIVVNAEGLISQRNVLLPSELRQSLQQQ